jgi:hypothetical protein
MQRVTARLRPFVPDESSETAGLFFTNGYGALNSEPVLTATAPVCYVRIPCRKVESRKD